jgi:hypothetical protein
MVFYKDLQGSQKLLVNAHLEGKACLKVFLEHECQSQSSQGHCNGCAGALANTTPCIVRLNVKQVNGGSSIPRTSPANNPVSGRQGGDTPAQLPLPGACK